MGTDLILLVPEDCKPIEGEVWGIMAVLTFRRRKLLWDAIYGLPAFPSPPLPDPFEGKRAWAVMARNLVSVVGDLVDDEFFTNRAIYAYLRALPPDWPVVLWWY